MEFVSFLYVVSLSNDFTKIYTTNDRNLELNQIDIYELHFPLSYYQSD